MVPDTPNNIAEIVREIKDINKKHQITEKLRAFRVAVDNQDGKKKNSQGYYILILNYERSTLNIKHFKPGQSADANDVYKQIEENKSETKIDAVLVRVASFEILKSAYPNYFSDIGEFNTILTEYLSTV